MFEERERRLLLVEDEAIIAMSEQQVLNKAGFQVDVAHSGERGVEEATANPDIALVLMDIDLGQGIDGTEAATRILDERRVPIVFLTSHAEQEMVDRVKGITRYGYVLKNSGPFVLVESVNMALELFDAHEESRRYAHRLQRLNRTYQVLSDVNQAIVRVKTKSELFDSICRITVDKGDFLFAWIGQPEEQDGTIVPVAAAGQDDGYVFGPNLDVSDYTVTEGFARRAYRLAQTEIVDETQCEEDMAPWREALISRGVRSAAALPVRVFDQVRFVFALYAPVPNFFDDEELGLLDELVMDLGFSVQARENEERRLEAERKNREWQKLISYVIDHDPNAIAVLDTDLCHIYVSERFCEDYGVSKHEVIGEHHYEVFPDIPQKWRRVHSRALAGEVLHSDDDYFVRLDGSIDYTRWECRPWYRPDGEVGGIVLYTEVVTHMKTAEEERRTVLGALESLLSNSPDLVSILDADGRYWMVSDSVASAVERPKDQIIGLKLEQVLSPEIASEFRRSLDRVVESGEGFSKSDVVRVAGGKRTFQTTLFPSREIDGRVTMVGAISVETTPTWHAHQSEFV